MTEQLSKSTFREILQRGSAIPAHPLALTSGLKLDERRQRAISRYYISAGVGGIAVGVHTTQFAIRDASVGLFKPVLELASEEIARANAKRNEPLLGIAGVCGPTDQAVSEASLASDLGYNFALLSLAAMKDQDEASLIEHCRKVGQVMPLMGFYLQPDVGGRVLSYNFWRRFAELECVAAIKIAPFNRYRTLDVIRAVADSGRDDIALYTGNDDNIVIDLVTPYRFKSAAGTIERRIVGGLLGHWAVWTQKAVELLESCRRQVASGQNSIGNEMLRLNIEITDCNAALFDAANQFAGCIAGLHEVLRRQGLLEGIWCLDESETLSPSQMQEIDRVYLQYPHLNDDKFVAEHLDEWMAG